MLRAVNLLPQAEFAAALWAEFYQAARKELILSDKVTVLGSCQASQAMAIAYDLFTDYEKPAAFAVLLKLIHEQDDHLDTGCLGARYFSCAFGFWAGRASIQNDYANRLPLLRALGCR